MLENLKKQRKRTQNGNRLGQEIRWFIVCEGLVVFISFFFKAKWE